MNSYEAIITESTKETFSSYIQCIDIPEIDYFAICVFHTEPNSDFSHIRTAISLLFERRIHS